MKWKSKRMFRVGMVWVGGLLALTPLARPQVGSPSWTNRFSSPGMADDVARAVAVDGSGNVFVAGYSYGGGGGGNFDYAILAYSSLGMPLWTNRYNAYPSKDSEPAAIALDHSNNVFVTGYTTASNYWYDYATIAYSATGAPLWTNRYNGPGNYDDRARALAVDDSGNVYVTGYSYGTNGYSDYMTIAYSGAGVPLWTNRYSGAPNFSTSATAIALDHNGHIFVTGDVAYGTVAYSSDGTLLWINRYKGPLAYNYASAITVDDDGNVFVTGTSDSLSQGMDCATVGYSGAGVPLWTNRYNGPGNGEDRATAIAAGNGKVFVAGYSVGVAIYEYAILAYSTAGVPLWTNRYSSPGDRAARAYALAVYTNGNVVITGYALATNGYEYATIAYSGAGLPLWTNRFNQPGGSSYAAAIALDPSGNTVVTGSWSGNPQGEDYVTIKYSSSGRPSLVGSRLNDHLVLNWKNEDFLLQSAPVIVGPFTNIPGATSPYTNFITSPQQYFRLGPR